MASLRETVLAYMHRHNVMTLATHGPDGPWAAAVFYANDGFDLIFLSAPTTRHVRNLEAQPRVAATIQEDNEHWSDIKGIQLQAAACRLPKDQQADAMERYQEKFPIIGPSAPDEIARAMSNMAWWKLVPDRLYFVDNSRGLGHRDEVPLAIRP